MENLGLNFNTEQLPVCHLGMSPQSRELVPVFYPYETQLDVVPAASWRRSRFPVASILLCISQYVSLSLPALFSPALSSHFLFCIFHSALVSHLSNLLLKFIMFVPLLLAYISWFITVVIAVVQSLMFLILNFKSRFGELLYLYL